MLGRKERSLSCTTCEQCRPWETSVWFVPSTRQHASMLWPTGPTLQPAWCLGPLERPTARATKGHNEATTQLTMPSIPPPAPPPPPPQNLLSGPHTMVRVDVLEQQPQEEPGSHGSGNGGGNGNGGGAGGAAAGFGSPSRAGGGAGGGVRGPAPASPRTPVKGGGRGRAGATPKSPPSAGKVSCLQGRDAPIV